MTRSDLRPGRRPRGRAWSAALLTLALAASGHAQTAEDKAAADALFDAARKAMDAGDYGAACPKFADSQKLDPGVGTLLNLARCYDLSGKSGSAYSTYREAAAMARAEGQTDREEFARKEVARLEGKLTRLVVLVGDEAAAIEGLTIERAGKVLPETMWGVPVPVDPGPQTIEVSAPGYVSRTASVEALGAGKTVELGVPVLVRAEPSAPVAAPIAAGEPAEEPKQPVGETQPATPQDERPRSGPGVAPWIVGGAGIVALGVGTAFAFKGLAENDKAKAICADIDPSLCPGSEIEQWQEAREAAQTNYTIAYIGWGVGAAAVVGSVVWLIVGNSSSKASALRLTPVATGQEFGLVAGGRF